MRVKYIRTSQNEIIVFSELLQHSDFKHFQPVTAGFVHISASSESGPTIRCYGESISLKLKSETEEDSELARKQILGYGYI